MRLSFVPGELVLEKVGGDYVVTVRGEEVHRGRVEKKALAEYNRLRKQMETEFPAGEWTPEQKRALLDRMVAEARVGLLHNSVREPKKRTARTRTFG